jgi:hypothetical protein
VLHDSSGCDALADQVLSSLQNRHSEDFHPHGQGEEAEWDEVRACAMCAVLCCAVLCCAVLCCAVLCCAVLCCTVLCCIVLWCAALYPTVMWWGVL